MEVRSCEAVKMKLISACAAVVCGVALFGLLPGAATASEEVQSNVTVTVTVQQFLELASETDEILHWCTANNTDWTATCETKLLECSNISLLALFPILFPNLPEGHHMEINCRFLPSLYSIVTCENSTTPSLEGGIQLKLLNDSVKDIVLATVSPYPSVNLEWMREFRESLEKLKSALYRLRNATNAWNNYVTGLFNSTSSKPSAPDTSVTLAANENEAERTSHHDDFQLRVPNPFSALLLPLMFFFVAALGLTCSWIENKRMQNKRCQMPDPDDEGNKVSDEYWTASEDGTTPV